MAIRSYTEHLGLIADEQFQAALDRFASGKFLHAEPIPLGNFGQNIFVTSDKGEYVLRGKPLVGWQFSTEQFFARLLHERTQVPVPWPYHLDQNEDIFGWSYILMPRMPGLQVADPAIYNALGKADKHQIARALGETLAQMQELTWPFSGRYDATSQTIQPFEFEHEVAWPFPEKEQPHAIVSHRERIIAIMRHHLALSRSYNDHTTADDAAWVEDIISQTEYALDDTFQPCFVMEDYKLDNLVVTQTEGVWHVSGVFDLMAAQFADGEMDLSRTVGMYIKEDPQLARNFIQAYISKKPPRPGFGERFTLYMLRDRLILWEFFQKQGLRWWDETWTLRDWASPYTSFTPFS